MKPETVANLLSALALLISLGSLAISWIVWRRDRPRIVAKSYATRHPETGEFYQLQLSIVNAGQRPIVLRWLAGEYSDSSKIATPLGDGDVGLKLEPGAFLEHRIGKFDSMMVGDLDQALTPELLDLEVHDSAGLAYKIRDARRSIDLVQKSKHPFGVR